MPSEFCEKLKFLVSPSHCALHFIGIAEFFDHENIIKLVDIQRPDHPTEYTEVYIITEKMEADLNRLIHSR